MKKYRLFQVVLLALFVTILTVGCGPRSPFRTEPIDGAITLDGKPLSEALVAMDPIVEETPDAKPAYGKSDSDGNFKITAANGGLVGKGTTVGKYRIGVIKEVGTTPLSEEQVKEMNAKGIAVQLVFKSVIPITYNDPGTSGLTFEVVKGKNVLHIDLKSK